MKKATVFTVLISLWTLNPIMKMVSELIPIMCILALILKNRNKKAKMVLIIPPTKKKYKLGKRSKVILFSIKIVNNSICKIKGILRCEMSESITVSTFPKVLSK